MDADTNLILTLLVVRGLGGQSVPAGEETVKGLKKLTEEAVRRGWLQEATARVTTTTKTGKVSTKSVKALSLTPEGERRLSEATGTEAVAAANLAQLAAFRQSLEADRQALRDEIRVATAGKGKTAKGTDPAKEITQLAKTVGDLAKRIEALEGKLTGGGTDPALARIDQGFATVLARLDRTMGTPSPAPVPKPAPAAVPAPPSADPLPVLLRSAYERLCCFREFQDGLVEIPRLYHEVHKAVPNLSVEEFHRELEGLWQGRRLELKVLNEVREAKEPEKGLRRNENLYYFVYWPNP